MKILVLCTGNSCRSQLAEGILKHFFPDFESHSAGTHPEKDVNPFAVKVMREIGIDISSNKPKLVDEYINTDFDYVFTVCDSAKENCPYFSGKVKHRVHMPFPDPARAKGSYEEVADFYRKTRDDIKKSFLDYFREKI